MRCEALLLFCVRRGVIGTWISCSYLRRLIYHRSRSWYRHNITRRGTDRFPTERTRTVQQIERQINHLHQCTIRQQHTVNPANTKPLYNICTMLDQRRAGVVQMFYKCFVFSGSPANTINWNNVVLMLVQSLRRRPKVKTTLFQCIVSAGKAVLKMALHGGGFRQGSQGSGTLSAFSNLSN